MVASGLLQPGEEIAPVRTLAFKLNVTPNTVVKAYDELEAAMTEYVVEVRQLTRRFGATLVLDAVDFKAERGRVYGLVGANGADKRKPSWGLHRVPG